MTTDDDRFSYVRAAPPAPVAEGVAADLPPSAEGARARRVLFEGDAGCAVGLVVCTGLLALCCSASLVYGSVEMSWSTALSALTSFDGSNAHVIVRELRVPRTLIGLAVGAALALAGALMQGVTRNPLAEPGLLGVNAGATLAVVGAIYLLDISRPADYVWFAFVGAGLTSAAVYALGSGGRGPASPVRLVLAGAVMSALLFSLTSAILVVDVEALDQYRF